jgi:hypothetical protein
MFPSKLLRPLLKHPSFKVAMFSSEPTDEEALLNKKIDKVPKIFGISLKTFVCTQMVKENKVVLFMKGEPADPKCGFSKFVVEILRFYSRPLIFLRHIFGQKSRDSSM